jgi:hypothetical protein
MEFAFRECNVVDVVSELWEGAEGVGVQVTSWKGKVIDCLSELRRQGEEGHASASVPCCGRCVGHAGLCD